MIRGGRVKPGDRAVPVASDARRTALTGHPQRHPCLELLQAGNAGDRWLLVATRVRQLADP